MACNGTPGLMTYNELQYTMKSEVKKYTFEDWRDGKIPVPPYPEDENSTEFDKLHWKATTGGENRLYHWTETKPSRISKVVYKKILDEKKSAWFTAVKQNAEQRLLKFKSENDSFSKDELTEIIELELEKSQISNPDILQKVKQKKYYSELITPEVYNKIQDGQYLRVNEFNKPYPKEVIEWMIEQQHQVRVQLGIQNPTWQDKINLFVAAEQNMYLKGIQHLLNTLNKEDVVKSKQYTPEEQKTYFEYAEWQADRLIERFNTKLSHGTDVISKEDLLQMEIKEVDARVQKYFMYIEHARRGWIEEHIIEYLKREEHPPPSIKNYSQFDAVKDYKYLKKLQAEVSDSNKKLSTAKSRINFVEGFYFKNNGSQNDEYTWDDAVNDAKKADSRIPYKNGKSFLNARRNLRERTK